MASAETQTDIIELVVGMVGAAPGATILADLAAIVDAGTTLEGLAVAIAENPAFSGDSGLYPDFFPNEIFATNWLAAFLGDTVSAANMTLAVEAVTGLLNSGTSRGAVMYAAITAVSGIDVADPDFGDAAAQLANQTAAAEYYSITVAQDGADLDALQAAIAGVDETAASLTTATTAIDTLIAASQDVGDLINNLTAALAAKAAFLAEADGDGNPLTSTTDVALAADLVTAEGDVAADPAVGGTYVGASDALKAALLSDAAAADAITLGGLNTTLTATLNDTAGTGSVTGLDAAIAVYDAAVDVLSDAGDADVVANSNLVGAMAAYGTLNTEATAVVTGTDGAVNNAAAAPIVVYSAVTKTLSLAPAVTEITDPGVTAILAASQANEAAEATLAIAAAAEALALDGVENLDPGVGAPAAALGAVGLGMLVITPTSVTNPTLAEITAETNGLASLLTAGNAAAVVGAFADLDAALAALKITLDAAGTIPAVTALTATAVTDGYITSADKILIDAAADGAANTAESVVMLANNASARDAAFTVLTGTYFGLGAGALAAATSPLAFAADAAATAVALEQLAQAGLAADVAAEDVLEASIAEGAVLDLATGAANTAFGDAGFATPVALDLAVHAATVADDLFTTAGTTSQIISFSGDDTLFIGDDLTLNADTTAGDEGDNAVLEVWITGTTNAVITIEESVFGSDAAVPETYTITLTGVAAADVSFADGFISIA